MQMPKWLQSLENLVEGVADDLDEVYNEAVESATLESVKAGIIGALLAVKAFPFIPSAFVVGCSGGIEITVSGVRTRLLKLTEYTENPPKTRQEVIDFFFAFVPTQIKIVPELEASIFGVNLTLGKGGIIIEGADVQEALTDIVSRAKEA